MRLKQNMVIVKLSFLLYKDVHTKIYVNALQNLLQNKIEKEMRSEDWL